MKSLTSLFDDSLQHISEEQKLSLDFAFENEDLTKILAFHLYSLY
ncbi:MAG: hypothetical protein WCR30_04105 [Clostridia bacterium]